MRRLNVLAGVFGAALLMSSGAFAQVPADPNNPNETIPDAIDLPSYGEPINIETAKKAARGRDRRVQEAGLEWSVRRSRRSIWRSRLLREAG